MYLHLRMSPSHPDWGGYQSGIGSPLQVVHPSGDLRLGGHSGRTVRRHDAGVAGFAIECGQGEVHGGCADTEGAERDKGHSSLRQP